MVTRTFERNKLVRSGKDPALFALVAENWEVFIIAIFKGSDMRDKEKPPTARVTVTRRVFVSGIFAIALVGLGSPGSSRAASDGWGTYLKPFGANSPWNSRPVGTKLDTQVIPLSQFPPAFGEGAFSTGVFLGQESDGPVTVTGLAGTRGLYDTDAENFHDITIAHWPSNTTAATGSDGHADVVDPIKGIVYSFFQLRNDNGQWRANSWAWTRIDGRGWGDPAHYSQGSRAAAVAPTGGLIRKHEINDGDSMYRHALSMSLTSSGLSPAPAYVFPATSADSNAATSHTGLIPEGALMMLPYAFDTRQISNLALRKVAQTLKTYGAYVVDRNSGVPFIIYAENGSGLGALNSAVAADMEKIRLSLRRASSARAWLDGDNNPSITEINFNILSMRGAWATESGTGVGHYETLQQALIIPEAATETVLVNFTNRGVTPLLWTAPIAGAMYRLTAVSTGDAKLRLRLYDPVSSAILYDSGALPNGESTTFPWPSANAKLILNAISSTGQAATVSGELLRVN